MFKIVDAVFCVFFLFLIQNYPFLLKENMGDNITPFIWKRWGNYKDHRDIPLLYGHCGCLVNDGFYFFGGNPLNTKIGAKFLEIDDNESSNYFNNELHYFEIEDGNSMGKT